MTISEFAYFYVYTHDSSYVFHGHAHNEWEFNLILEGEFCVTCGAQVIILTKGDFWIAAPWTFHCFRSLSDQVVRAVFSFHTEEHYPGPAYSARALSEYELSLVKMCVDDMTVLCRNSRKIYDGTDQRFDDCKKMCEILFSKVYWSESKVLVNGSSKAQHYKNAIRYMEQHICEKIMIEELAKELHISPTLLKSSFKEYANSGIAEYFMGMKIRYAKDLLLEGNSISYVSDFLGFSSQNYFSGVFKKVMGQTPKKYQMQHIKLRELSEGNLNIITF